MPQANATYSVKSWDRRPWHSALAEDTKLYRLEILHTYTGDIEGEGTLQYLLSQRGRREVNFVALEWVDGSVCGRSGSFVLQRIGTFDNGRIVETVIVVRGSGTGDLSSLSGQATIEHTQHLESYPITLDYELLSSNEFDT
jgi:hypothetical protein